MTLMEKEILEQPKVLAGIKAANIDTINKLVADINLGDDEENNVEGKIFYPIGYYNSEGTY